MKPPNPFLSEGSAVTLRDAFAAFAMQGILATGSTFSGSIETQRDFLVFATAISKSAYEFADAMLAERARGEGDRG